MTIRRVIKGYQIRYRPNRHLPRYVQTFPTYALAKQKETELKAQHARNRHHLPSLPIKITFARFMEDWYIRKYAKERYGRNFGRVEYYLNAIVGWLGSISLESMTYSLLSQTLQEQAAEHQWKQATKNYYTALIKRMFKMAKLWGLISVNPAVELSTPSPHNNRKRYAHWEELDRIWAAASPRLKKALIGLLNMGIRRGRLHEIMWETTDWETRQLCIGNKKGEDYWVYINDALYAELLTVPMAERKGPVFGVTYNTIRFDWEEAREKAGCPDLRLNDLRHTFATWSTARTKDLNKTQKALGHASPQMTNRYRHVIDAGLVEAFQSVQFRGSKSDHKVTTEGLNQANPGLSQVTPP